MKDPLQVMYQVAEVRGCKLKGNKPDLDKNIIYDYGGFLEVES